MVLNIEVSMIGVTRGLGALRIKILPPFAKLMLVWMYFFPSKGKNISNCVATVLLFFIYSIYLNI